MMSYIKAFFNYRFLIVIVALSMTCCVLHGSLERARRLIHESQFEQAIDILSDLLQADASMVEAQYLLAWAQASIKEYDQALGRLKWLNQIEPNNADYLELKLYIYEETKNFARAEAIAGKIQALKAPAVASIVKETQIEKENDLTAKEKISVPSQFDLRHHVKQLIENQHYLADHSVTFPDNLSEILLKSTEEEILMLYLRFRLGEVSSEDVRLRLALMNLPETYWARNEKLEKIQTEFTNSGIIRKRVQQRSLGTSWLANIESTVFNQLQAGNFKNAWDLHQENMSDTPTWHYESGRLALKNWLHSGFEKEWLQLSLNHLEQAQHNPFWRRDAEILIEQIKLRQR